MFTLEGYLPAKWQSQLLPQPCQFHMAQSHLEHLLLVDTSSLAALKISRGKIRATSKVVVDISLFNARGLACYC